MGRLSKAEKKRRLKNEQQKERYYFYSDHGICPQCGRHDAALGHTYCEDCLGKMKEQKNLRDPGHEKYKALKNARYAFRVENHICTSCGKPMDNDEHKKCNRCLEIAKINQRVYSLRKKYKAKGTKPGKE